MKKSKKQRNFDKKKPNAYDQNKKKIILYKTEFCRSFEETGYCRYKEKCQFAHSYEELRPVDRHPKYRTEMCKIFWEQGTCPYGKRCCFIHTFKNDTKNEELMKSNLINSKINKLTNISIDTPTTTSSLISNLTYDSQSSILLNSRLNNNSSMNGITINNHSNDSKMNINAKSFEPTIANTITNKLDNDILQNTNTINLIPSQYKNFDNLSELSSTSTLYSNPSLSSFNNHNPNNHSHNSVYKSGEFCSSSSFSSSSSSTENCALFDYNDSNILNTEAYNTLINNNSKNNYTNSNLSQLLDNLNFNYCASLPNGHGQTIENTNIINNNGSEGHHQTEITKNPMTEDTINVNLINKVINNRSNDNIYASNNPSQTIHSNFNTNNTNLNQYLTPLNLFMNINSNGKSHYTNQSSSSSSSSLSSSTTLPYPSLSMNNKIDYPNKSTPNTPSSLKSSPTFPMKNNTSISTSYRMNQNLKNLPPSNINNFTTISSDSDWIKYRSSSSSSSSSSSLDKLNRIKTVGNDLQYSPNYKVNVGPMMNTMKVSNSIDDYPFSMLPQNFQNNSNNPISHNSHPANVNQMKPMENAEPPVEKEMNVFPPSQYYPTMNDTIEDYHSIASSDSNFMNTHLNDNTINNPFGNDDCLLFNKKGRNIENIKLFSAFVNPKFQQINNYFKSIQNHNTTNTEITNNLINNEFNRKDTMMSNAINMTTPHPSFSNNNSYPKINNIISDFSTLSINNNNHHLYLD
ncbi:hypothetical protein BCR36DRAFT_406018 [Piromyces finnis]|uniref:C3H1-type domain-containing protein n=1 Tax=Piromyces finnis TaxID=1754191 RepID=A0A1Y1V344_9FUNG|nr:hypothetical protein BCR36DRAFT_406018 [Piromyces finnis]|eukprot:ORX45389.1 hypothetical protein BCR36DRAFT_406018 [Piromyces finnis]